MCVLRCDFASFTRASDTKKVAETKLVDDALKLDENEDRISQELSKFKENLNETKARVQKLQTFFDGGQNEADKGEHFVMT